MIEKEIILESCNADLASRHKRLLQEIGELQAANADNTKSTAGDKHETSRAMVHLELEKLGNQLALVEQMQADLAKISSHQPAPIMIRFGSVVYTNKGNFLLGVPCGKFNADGLSVFGLGMQSPLAKTMLGKAQGDAIQLNGNTFQLMKVF